MDDREVWAWSFDMGFTFRCCEEKSGRMEEEKAGEKLEVEDVTTHMDTLLFSEARSVSECMWHCGRRLLGSGIILARVLGRGPGGGNQGDRPLSGPGPLRAE